MARHIAMFSGGLGSWMAARRVREQEPDAEILCLFADTKMEDEDLYRFLHEAAADVGGELVVVAEGRDPWQVFFDKRYLGNTRIDPCSLDLKRLPLRKWLNKYGRPRTDTIHLGIGWDEEHRFRRALAYWEGWHVRAPLCEEPYLRPGAPAAALREAGIKRPHLYSLGFPHNNCGGFCIKAGQAHFRLLLEQLPKRYRYHEQQEQAWQKHVGKKNTILRDRRGGKTRPLSLREFRQMIQCGQGDQVDMFEWGGCGCFSGS